MSVPPNAGLADPAQVGDPLYFEDFAVGQVFPGQERRLDAAAFRTFAALTGDAHPIHYDADYARRTRFGAPVAHGLLVAFLEQGMRFIAPVLEGDAIRTEFEVAHTKPARDGGRGVVRFTVRVNSTSGPLVAEGFHTYLLACRPQPR
jgi:acyl dehydratase